MFAVRTFLIDCISAVCSFREFQTTLFSKITGSALFCNSYSKLQKCISIFLFPYWHQIDHAQLMCFMTTKIQNSLYKASCTLLYLWNFCNVKEIIMQLYSLCYFYLAYFSVSSPQYLCCTGSKIKGVSANLNMYKFEVSIPVTGQMYLYAFNAHYCWDYLRLYLPALELYLLFQISHFFCLSERYWMPQWWIVKMSPW